MKTLILSDLHLTTNFNSRQFKKLKNLISKVDKVIINGDFWESSEITFDEFVNSEWNRLFPLLKDKNTVYIYGNHDDKSVSDKRVNLFSVVQDYKYTVPVGEKVLYITHGQRVARYINKLHILLDKLKFLGRLAAYLIRVLVFVMGQNYYKIYSKMNTDMKNWAKKHLKKNEILVCGHSHLKEFNLNEKFINLGFNHYGYMQYLIVDNNKLMPKYERY